MIILIIFLYLFFSPSDETLLTSWEIRSHAGRYSSLGLKMPHPWSHSNRHICTQCRCAELAHSISCWVLYRTQWSITRLHNSQRTLPFKQHQVPSKSACINFIMSEFNHTHTYMALCACDNTKSHVNIPSGGSPHSLMKGGKLRERKSEDYFKKSEVDPLGFV